MKKMIMFMFLVSKTALAESLNFDCQVQVIKTVCGSGAVTIKVRGDQFEIQNGDVGCWFSDYKAQGSLLRAPQYFGFEYSLSFNVDQFALFKDGVQDGLEIGGLAINEDLTLAKIRLKSGVVDGVRSSEYHLSCSPM